MAVPEREKRMDSSWNQKEIGICYAAGFEGEERTVSKGMLVATKN